MTTQQEDDLKARMATPEGRRFIMDVYHGHCNVEEYCGETYTGNAGTYYNLGRRSVGVDIRDDVRALCPELWNKAIAEFLESMGDAK